MLSLAQLIPNFHVSSIFLFQFSLFHIHLQIPRCCPTELICPGTPPSPQETLYLVQNGVVDRAVRIQYDSISGRGLRR